MGCIEVKRSRDTEDRAWMAGDSLVVRADTLSQWVLLASELAAPFLDKRRKVL